MDFINDIKWRRGDLTLSICAIDASKAAVMVVRPFTQQHKHASWLVYFSRDVSGNWSAEHDGVGQLKVYDVKSAGDFVWLSTIPAEVVGIISETLDQLTGNDGRLVEIGADRAEQQRLRDEETLQAARRWALQNARQVRASLDDDRRDLEAYAKRQLGKDVSLSEIEPSDDSCTLREIVDYGFGPLVLTIQGHEVFTLSTPGKARIIDDAGKPLRFHAEWSGGKWKGAPQHSTSMMEKLNGIVGDILTDHAGKFTEIVRSLIANRLADIAIEEEAVSRYEAFLEREGTAPVAGMRP